jgi:hypothetical protein
MIFEEVKKTVDNAIKLLTNNRNSLYNLTGLPRELVFALPYFIMIRDYSKATTISNFLKSFNNFGSGRILSYSNFEELFLKKFEFMINWIKKYDNTNTPYDKKVYDTWIELFGSPDPLYFPGMPYNTITGNWNKKFQNFILVKKILSSYHCIVNANVLIQSLN